MLSALHDSAAKVLSWLGPLEWIVDARLTLAIPHARIKWRKGVSGRGDSNVTNESGARPGFNCPYKPTVELLNEWN